MLSNTTESQLLLKFKNKLNNNPDVLAREIFVSTNRIGVVYLKSLTNDEIIIKSIVEPMLSSNEQGVDVEMLKSKVLHNLMCEDIDAFDDAITEILKGKVIIFVDGKQKFISVDAEDFPSRPPSEPPTSSVLRGPREGFTESIKTNISLLRRRLASDKLVFKSYFVGKYSNTQICICYLDDIADKKIVKSIEKKIKKINIDGIIASYYVASLLETRPFSMFKQVGSTEKPDIACAKILEGRIAILVDNSPEVLTLPFLYTEEVQDSNDYYGRACYSSYMRWIRIIGLFLAVIVPGAYLAMRIYHYKVLPIKFLITISNSNQGLPFTPFVELLFILILFEILYEVSLRLPKYLGLATGIVGALVLGDTGVKAGLISPPGVMIIAMSIIAVYTIPDQAMQLGLLRMMFLLIGGCFGFLGMVAGIIYFTNYLNSLDAFSAPYLSPIAPNVKSDRKDAMFKRPLVEMKTRPKSFSHKNDVRYKNDEQE